MPEAFQYISNLSTIRPIQILHERDKHYSGFVLGFGRTNRGVKKKKITLVMSFTV